jgi:hypothetical protein
MMGKRTITIVVLFLIMSIHLSCEEIRQKAVEHLSLAETDSIFRCSEVISDSIIQYEGLGVIIYIEGDYCASCHSHLIYSLLSYLTDTIGYSKPAMIWHPNSSNETIQLISKEYFQNECNFILTYDDSVRVLNNWMNPSINFYCFIIDSSKKILHAGFLYDDYLKTKAKRLYYQHNKQRIQL